MNPRLQLAQETMKRLRSRRCVQRVVSLRLTMSETECLIDLIEAIDGNLKSALEIELQRRLANAKAKAVQRGCYREQANEKLSGGCRERAAETEKGN